MSIRDLIANTKHEQPDLPNGQIFVVRLDGDGLVWPHPKRMSVWKWLEVYRRWHGAYEALWELERGMSDVTPWVGMVHEHGLVIYPIDAEAWTKSTLVF
jgi:hypothetical protein